jgi:hypothetical protein
MLSSLISAIVILLLVVFAASLAEVVGQWRLVRRMPSSRAADLSNLNIQPSVPAARMIDQLNRLGFAESGGGSSEMGRRAWYLVDEMGTTVAAVSIAMAATIYHGWDEACIVHSILRYHGPAARLFGVP